MVRRTQRTNNCGEHLKDPLDDGSGVGIETHTVSPYSTHTSIQKRIHFQDN